MPSKTKPITPPSPEITEDLAQEPNIAPLLEPPLPSSILQSAIARQEQELTNLQTELDRRSDEFADRAALIVRNSLETAYQKAQSRIMTIEVPSFFDLEGNSSPSLSLETLNALPVGEVTEC